jgi:hypothetical protein
MSNAPYAQASIPEPYPRDRRSCCARTRPGRSKTITDAVSRQLRFALAWAVKEGLIDVNPVIGTNVAAEAARERVLTDGELRVIWNGLNDDHYGAIVKLL